MSPVGSLKFNIELPGVSVGSLELNIQLPRVLGGLIGVEYQVTEGLEWAH